jgi:hypothetical protein
MKVLNIELYIRSSFPGQVASKRRALHAVAIACGWRAIEFVNVGPWRRVGPGLGRVLAAARDHDIGTIACTSVELLTRAWLASLLDEFGQDKLVVVMESGSQSPRRVDGVAVSVIVAASYKSIPRDIDNMRKRCTMLTMRSRRPKRAGPVCTDKPGLSIPSGRGRFTADAANAAHHLLARLALRQVVARRGAR